jgi:hypothetical protein
MHLKEKRMEEQRRRIKEVGLETRTCVSALFAHAPLSPDLISVPQRPPLSPFQPSPITAVFRVCGGSSGQPPKGGQKSRKTEIGHLKWASFAFMIF